MKKQPREWQKRAFKEIDASLDFYNKNKETTIINNIAAVGAGKTDVASYSFANFILENFEKKTFQAFICPRISLCKDQLDSIKNFLIDYGIKEGSFDVVEINCKSESTTKKLEPKNYKHIIAVYCDKSFWEESDNKWAITKSTLKNFKKNDFKFGFINFDEAHNYENSFDKILDRKKYQI